MGWVCAGFGVGVVAASAYLLLGGSYFFNIPPWARVLFFPGFVAGYQQYGLGLGKGAGLVVGVLAVGLAYAQIAGLAKVLLSVILRSRARPASGSASTTSAPIGRAFKPTLAAVFALGVSCIITQLAVMREMLGAFAGNELVLGVALGNWLLLMGLGAALGRCAGPRLRSPRALIGLLVLTALLPPAQIVALRALRSLVFLRGEAIGVVGTVVTSFVVLLPYCLAAGLFLALAASALAEARGPAAGAGRVYTLDSLGSVAGGAVFSFVLVFWLDHVALLVVPALLNLLAAGWLAERHRRERNGEGALLLAVIVVFGAGVLAWTLPSAPDESSTARQFPGQRVLFRGSSPYGRLVVAESAGQTNFIENGVVLASTPNIEEAEETAHFALAQRPAARQVLLIGGALSGASREILRYRVTTLDCVELDPLAVSAGRRFLPSEFRDPRLRVHEADARQFVRYAARGAYDVIIVALPDPTTAQLNRFFTHEFFQEARRALRPEGVLSFAVGRYENYAGADLSRLLSCARQTAARSFDHVLLIPGGRVYFLASDGPLTTDIASGLEQAGVATKWVNRSYLAAALTPDRLADLAGAAARAAPVNRDFAPVLYDLHLRHWASQFATLSRGLVILLAAAGAIYVLRLRGAAGVVFASGFAGSALEIILLLAMQIVAGSVYRQVAWVVTLFMAGLAAGAWVATRHLERPLLASGEPASPHPGHPKRALCWLGVGVALAAALLPMLLPMLARLTAWRSGDAAAQALLLLFTFALAVLVGAQFPIANALATGERPAAARLYTADFIGASLGALLTSAWLVPLAGLAGVCWIAGALNVVAMLVLLRTKVSL